MRLTVSVLFCLALGFSAEAKPENVSSRTDKRALSEGNASLDKRAPANGPAAQPPAIEYAESTTVESDKSPTQLKVGKIKIDEPRRLERDNAGGRARSTRAPAARRPSAASGRGGPHPRAGEVRRREI
ncbi:hypothetical protein EVAR_15892_1 [Eumeta japonica]|uniref:Uncharacterized protein n=1 Tax=Eumeta variegata TaxID=151549 RepID=A0A4C1UFF4_EUMVA|nr:hypothetical protein EVAR_15892_1 [Eumeta japonica]